MTETERRFQAARAHPLTVELLSRTPRSAQPPGLSDVLSSVAAVLLFVLIGLLCTFAMASVFPPLAILPVAVVIAGLGFYAAHTYREWRRPEAQGVQRLALVLSEETRMTGSGTGSGRTAYLFTLEYDDGSRAELRSPEEPSGHPRTGEIGVALQRADVLVEFEKVPV